MSIQLKEHTVIDRNHRMLVEIKETEDMLNHVLVLSGTPIVKTDWTVDDSQVISLFKYVVEDTFFMTRITALMMTDVFENLTKNSERTFIDLSSVSDDDADTNNAKNESEEGLTNTFTITSQTFEKIDEYRDFGLSGSMAAYFAMIDVHDLMNVSRISELIKNDVVVQMDNNSFESTLEMFCVLANQSKNPEVVIKLFKMCGKTFLMQKEFYELLLSVPATFIEDADISKPAVMNFLRNSIAFFSGIGNGRNALNLMKIGIKLFSDMEESSYRLHSHYVGIFNARSATRTKSNGQWHQVSISQEVPSAAIFEECFDTVEEKEVVASFLKRMMYNEYGYAEFGSYGGAFSSRNFGAGGVDALSIAKSVYAAALTVHGPKKIADAVMLLMEYGETVTLGHLLVLIDDEDAIQDSVIPNYLFVLAGLPELVSEDVSIVE